MANVHVGIIGVSGFGGVETLRILLRHPEISIGGIYSHSNAGTPIADLYTDLHSRTDLVCEDVNIDAIAEANDIVFLALPHTKSQELGAALLDKGVRIIDLGADFRLDSAQTWETHYGVPHLRPDLLETAVYGLSEVYGDAIKNATLLANPGCFPTASLLAMAPALQHYAADVQSVIIDAKSGVSGAGRNPNPKTHFSQVFGNFNAYKVAEHQHQPEITQYAHAIAGTKFPLFFQPHLLPIDRGILSTVYITMSKVPSEDEVVGHYRDFCGKHPFLRYQAGSPQVKDVAYSNFCDLMVKPFANGLIVLSAIDNLQKGAAGQAVQNMNLMLGLACTSGMA